MWLTRCRVDLAQDLQGSLRQAGCGRALVRDSGGAWVRLAFGVRVAHLAWPLGEDDAVFAQEPPHLIDKCRALRHEPAADPVQHLCVLLGFGVDGHKTHPGAADRLTDRRGIVTVVLVTLDIGLDVLGRHELDRMPELHQLPRPVVGPGASLHADEARRKIGKELQHLCP